MSLIKPTLLQKISSHLGVSCRSIIKPLALICRNLILVASVSLCAWNVSVAEESSEQRESQIVAAYLYHFIKFTEWPTVSPVFHYCVYEDASFAELLRKTYGDKTIGKASIDFKNINAQSILDDCQLIYFPQDAPTNFLEKISKHPILSIGMQIDFTELGGIIYLFQEDQKLRFYINNATATQAGLKISSQLLQLSKEP